MRKAGGRSKCSGFGALQVSAFLSYIAHLNGQRSSQDTRLVIEADTTSLPRFRCGFVAIAGAPNAGKSTLLNTLLGLKLSIVSSRPQTTRRRVLGFHTSDTHQIIFIDTPGLITPRYELQKSMMISAGRALHDADLVLVMFDGTRLRLDRPALPQQTLDLLASARKPAIAVLNKIDLLREEEHRRRLIAAIAATHPFSSIHAISALDSIGTDELIPTIVAHMPEHPAYYPEDQLSDEPERFFVSELIREKIFELFEQEVPYSTEVYIQEFTVEAKLTRIAAEIVVERESQRGILIGAGGRMIREIGTRARKDIQDFLQRKVFLALHIKVREGWRDSNTWVRRFGYPVD